VVEDCLWDTLPLASTYLQANRFAYEGWMDALRYSVNPATAHWALNRLTRVCWGVDNAEKYDADDNGSYSGSRVRLQARFAEVIRMRIPEVP
jgi:hypothetical protein